MPPLQLVSLADTD